jgi:hypothetical protein
VHYWRRITEIYYIYKVRVPILYIYRRPSAMRHPSGRIRFRLAEASETASAPCEAPSEASETASAPCELPSEVSETASAPCEAPSEVSESASAPCELPSELCLSDCWWLALGKGAEFCPQLSLWRRNNRKAPSALCELKALFGLTSMYIS